MGRLSLNEVFPTVGKPTITYVERDNGEPDRRLTASLKTPGQICMLTGPSKLGKTSLYQRVVPAIRREPLIIRCSGKLDARNFWASALEKLNFEQIAERISEWGLATEASIGVKGELGWKWLAALIPSISVKTSGELSSSVKKQLIHADISAGHLIPLLKSLPLQLVVEDFHYLDASVKKEIFQQWKSFVDEGVSVLVISTQHHSTELFSANPDLTGRTRIIDLGQWRIEDLERIVQVGFDYLGIKNGTAIRRFIANESVGVPIITQQICYDFSSKLDLEKSSNDLRKNYHPEHVTESVISVAKEFYRGFERDYDRLIEGPRSRARKYDTHSLILSAFVMNPICFSMSKMELVDRIGKLTSGSSPIPMASINSSLKALSSHQRRMERTLLEWQPDKQMLHIIEPTFVFYLRQRVKEDRGTLEGQLDWIQQLFKQFDVPYIRESIIPRNAGPRITRINNS